MHVTSRFRGYVTAVIVFLTIVSMATAKYGGGGGTDLTNDGLFDFQDLMIFGENWLRPIGP